MKKKNVSRKLMCGVLILFFLAGTGSFVFSQSDLLMGDVNLSGTIDIVDSLLTAQYSSGLSVSPFYPAAADVNQSGIIDIIDALLIAQYSTGIIKTFPAGGIQFLQSALMRDKTPQLASGELSSVVTGNNQFTFDCYSKLSSQSGNLFFSPVSINIALAMCYAGANGNTKAEMAETMHYTLADDRLHNAFNALDLSLTTSPVNPDPKKGDDLILRIANSSWGEKEYQFISQYLDILAENYGAGLNLVDFRTQPDKSRLLINDWVSQQTEQRIKDLLAPGTITTLTRLVLTNTIYFKANWLTPFIESNTISGPFYLADGSTVAAFLMHKKTITPYYEATGKFQAIKLPYQGTRKNAMLVILPAAGQFASFENSFTLDTFNTILKGMINYDVQLSLPKFSFEWSSSLKEMLQSLGMKEAFTLPLGTSGADFTGISSTRDLYISDVIHKSFVAVDEKGTEASAATAVVMATVSMPPSAIMTINRPFIFIIYNEDTGTILFLGRVMQP